MHRWLARGRRALRKQLTDAQEEGVRFMLRRELHCGGGINADDMGLGKTVMTAFLIAARPFRTLIAVPQTLLRQWREHLKEFVGIEAATVMLRKWRLRCQETGEEVNPLEGGWLSGLPRRCVVVITTHTVFEHLNMARRSAVESQWARLMAEAEDILKDIDKRASDGTRLPTDRHVRRLTRGKVCTLRKWLSQREADRANPLMSVKWERFIIDEGQSAKNSQSLIWNELCRLEARHKWVLSGTPCHNRPKDFASLITLVGGDKAREFIRRARFGRSQIRRLRKAARGLWIRRSKRMKVGGSPVLTLPTLKYQRVFASFSPAEMDFYRRVRDHLTALPRRSIQLARVLHLRQTCVSPLLCMRSMDRGELNRLPGVAQTLESLRRLVPQMSAKMKTVAHVLRLLSLEDSPDADKVIIYTQWAEEASFVVQVLNVEGLSYTRLNGGMTSAQRGRSLKRFREGTSCNILLAHINVAGVGLNLQEANAVLFVVPDFNVAQEMQAVCRAYRMGQTRAVTVFRCVVRGTLEEDVVRQQYRKALHTSTILCDPHVLEHMHMAMEAENEISSADGEDAESDSSESEKAPVSDADTGSVLTALSFHATCDSTSPSDGTDALSASS